MDVLRDLGALALGSRLRRLSDRLMQDSIRIYRDSGAAFEPRWFPMYYHLHRGGPSAVTDLARALGISHPAVNQTGKEMMRAGLVAASADEHDKRRRVLALTVTGHQLIHDLERIWTDIEAVLDDLLDSTQVDFLAAIGSLERALDKTSFHQMYVERRRRSGIEIVDFAPHLAGAFKRLNEAAIRDYFKIEDADYRILDNPGDYVIANGGAIVFARDTATGEVLGTGALLVRGQGKGELAKMAVAKAARGRGIGRLIAEAIVARAKKMSLEVLFLETNGRLVAALALYRSMGFVRKQPTSPSAYARAEIYMEMAL